MSDERFEALRPSAVRRLRGRWRPRIARLRQWSTRTPRLRRKGALAARERRNANIARLRLVLARRPARVLHVSGSTHVDGRSWLSSHALLQTLNAERAAAAPQQLLTVARAAAPRVTPASRSSSTTPTMLLQPVVTPVSRERTHYERVERLESTASVAGPRGPAGPSGEPGAPGDVTRVLARARVPGAVEASPATEPAQPAPTPLRLVEERPPAARDAPLAIPDVEELTTQVLRRIERRAIAQRERLGSVP